MAFILRSSKHVCNFLGFARRASLTNGKRKVLLLNYENYFMFNELRGRTAATASPKPVTTNTYSLEKNIANLHNNLKAGLVDLNSVEKTFNSLKEIRAMTSTQLILLLKCCGNAAFRDSEQRRINMARSIWETAKDFGIELDITHYNNLLSVFVENSYKFSPEEVYADLKKNGLEPNRVTYKYMLKAYCQQGDINGAGNLLEKLKQSSYPISEYDFCSLIQGHCEAGELEEAEKIFTVMKDKGIKPSLEPFIYLLCGYAKHGKIDKLEALLEQMKDLEVRMTDSYLLNVVYTLIVNNHEEHVDAVLERMKRCNDYEKTLMRVVHRLLHKRKDEQALKLFGLLSTMNYVEDYISSQALIIVDHFIFNRSPAETVNICRRLEKEGWTKLATSQCLKKAITKMDLDYCATLLHLLRKINFPLRPHYFWPLIVRFSEEGNQGILSVLRVMKAVAVVPCFNTINTFVRDYYKFSSNWQGDIGTLKKSEARECHVTLAVLNELLLGGDLVSAEALASSYGIFKPRKHTLKLLVNCFSKTSCNEQEEKFLKTLYYLAHDFSIYKTHDHQDLTEAEEELESTELNGFFDEAFKLLMSACPEDEFFTVLQNVSKKEITISSEVASLIRKNYPNAEVGPLLEELVDSKEFELNQDLLTKKSENVSFVSKLIDQSGIISLANQNDLKAEALLEDVGSKATIDHHLAVLSMYARMKMYDKAFDLLDRMKNCSDSSKNGFSREKKFRVALHLLHESGEVEKMVEAYKTGVQLGLINDGHILPIIRTIFKSNNPEEAIKNHFQLLTKVQNVGTLLSVLQILIPKNLANIIEDVINSFAKLYGESAAYSTLFTAYLASGCWDQARELLDKHQFKFRHSIFLYWFKDVLNSSENSFEEAVQILKNFGSLDRTPVYAFLLTKFERENDPEKIKKLWLLCQEDDVTDPFFLEHLRQSMMGKNSKSHRGLRSAMSWTDEDGLRKAEDLLRTNRYSPETFERFKSGKLPSEVARKMLPVLAAEGKSFELIMAVNKYKFGKYIPEIASKMLQAQKIVEFWEFVNAQASMKMFHSVYNCFATQEKAVFDLMKSDESFSEKVLQLAQRCYEENQFEVLLVFCLKACIQLPGKLSQAEELLSTTKSGLVAHFRNSMLSNLLLSQNEDDEVEFCKNALASEKVKSVFSRSLELFYNRVISFYNEKGDIESIMSYLEKARADGVEGKLNKQLISSVKANMERKGSSFPYPEMLQGAA